jgi:hypothetical protein
MIKQMLIGLVGILFSSFLAASDWKELPSGNTGFYTENKTVGSRVILSDIATGSGIMSVALFTINSKCTNRDGTGEAYMHINKVEVCYSFKKELKGLCFSAIGFDAVSTKLSDIIAGRNNAL